jgi:GNAT superfamily N-acetyltransferase
MIRYEVYSGKDVIEIATTALQERLYHHPDWSLKQTLKVILKFGNIMRCTIAAAFDGETLIGICYNDKYLEVETYVRPNYRRKGIGSELLKLVYVDGTTFNYGIEGSLEFYLKNQLEASQR